MTWGFEQVKPSVEWWKRTLRIGSAIKLALPLQPMRTCVVFFVTKNKGKRAPTSVHL